MREKEGGRDIQRDRDRDIEIKRKTGGREKGEIREERREREWGSEEERGKIGEEGGERELCFEIKDLDLNVGFIINIL